MRMVLRYAHFLSEMALVQLLTCVMKVATVMLVTTILLAIQMRYVKRWPVPVGVGFLVVFGFLDAIFWGAALKKIPHGAWVPVVIGTILCVSRYSSTLCGRLTERVQRLAHVVLDMGQSSGRFL